MPTTPLQSGLRLLGAGVTHDVPSSWCMQLLVFPATYAGGALGSEFDAFGNTPWPHKIVAASRAVPLPWAGGPTPVPMGGGACCAIALVPIFGLPMRVAAARVAVHSVGFGSAVSYHSSVIARTFRCWHKALGLCTSVDVAMDMKQGCGRRCCIAVFVYRFGAPILYPPPCAGGTFRVQAHQCAVASASGTVPISFVVRVAQPTLAAPRSAGRICGSCRYGVGGCSSSDLCMPPCFLRQIAGLGPSAAFVSVPTSAIMLLGVGPC